MSVADFAKALGIEAQTVRDYENGKSIPGGDKVAKLIELGVDSNWLLAGPGYDSVPFNAFLTVAKKYQSTARKQNPTAWGVTEPLPEPKPGSVYVNRFLDVKGSAGPGYFNDSDGLIELVEFNAMALKHYVNVPAEYLVIAGVSGSSMEPHLFDGDQVFIDIRLREFKDDGIYAILHDGYLRFKRVRINYADKTVLIKSDNDGGMGPETLTEKNILNLSIVGKVLPFKFGQFKI